MPLARAHLLLLIACAARTLPAAADPLVFVEAHFHADNSFDGLQGAAVAAVSPDGANVYVAGKADDAVSEWSRDGSTGALTYLGRALCADPVCADPTKGTVPNFDRPEALALSPGGEQLYVGVGNSHALVILSRDSEGGLSYAGSILDGADGASVQRVLSIAVSPDGEFVYAGDFCVSCAGAVTVFSRDASTGLLSHVQTVTGPNHVHGIALSPGAEHLYVTSHTDNSITVYARDAGTGMLSFVEMQQQGVGGVDGLVDPYQPAVSPDGLQLYVASYGNSPQPGAVAVFARDPSTGRLAFVTSHSDSELGLTNVDDLSVAPDGTRVYVIAQGELAVYDGKLAVLSRDPATGALARLATLADGTNGVIGLKGALGVATSPDSQNVYVASEQAVPPMPAQTQHGAVAVFQAPEPESSTMALAVLAVLAQLSASQSRGRRNTS